MDIPRCDHSFKETYPGGDYSADEQEWLKAVERAKRVSGRSLDCTDLARILWELGYRRDNCFQGMIYEGTWSPDAERLRAAIASYKAQHSRPLPTNTELLAIAKFIGYAKPQKDDAL